MSSKAHLGTFLRTQETWEAYKKAPRRNDDACFLCDLDGVTIIKEFTHWMIVENQYPYDAVADHHHMLIPREHVQNESQLSTRSKLELNIIKRNLELSEEYDCTISNFPIGQSHPTHLHFHLIRWLRRA